MTLASSFAVHYRAEASIMCYRICIALPLLFVTIAAAQESSIPLTLAPYPLPAKAQQALGQLAAETDVLILGELHGTQEVPQLASALLEPLSKEGYGILALEIPADQQ